MERGVRKHRLKMKGKNEGLRRVSATKVSLKCDIKQVAIF